MTTDTLGRFVWHDLMTREGEKAQAFYTEMFGWKVIPQDMGGFQYPMIHLGEQPIGGIIQENLPEGVPSHWMTYVRVADLDACLKACTDNGGAICIPPMPIPGTGRFAVITDPQGAAISPIQLDDPKPLPADGTTGMFCWDELHSKDTAQSKAFYAAVFGWSWNEMDMGPAGLYHTIAGGETGWGGCMELPAEVQAQGAPSAWMPYILVEDVDAAHAKATGMGANTYVPPSDIPGIGRFAVLCDPTGAAVAVYTLAAAPA